MLGILGKVFNAVNDLDGFDLRDYEKRLKALRPGQTFKAKMDSLKRRQHEASFYHTC